jgi:hypothetical protein
MSRKTVDAQSDAGERLRSLLFGGILNDKEVSWLTWASNCAWRGGSSPPFWHR